MNDTQTTRPGIAAKIAGLIVVTAGSGTFVYAAIHESFEMAAAAAAFTCTGLYLLFGRKPPT